MKVYIMRHGETDWNKEMRMQGQTDIPLNEYGKELARITGEGIKDIKIDYAFSSPLVRAKETAEIVLGDRGIDIVCDDRLKEIGFGSYEGLGPEKRPESFPNFFNKPECFVNAPDGETFENLRERTGEFIKEVLVPLEEREPDAAVFISGHGAMNKGLMMNFKGLGIKDFWAGPFHRNCSLSVVDITDGEFTVLEENRIYYEEDTSRMLWDVVSIEDADYGCEEIEERKCLVRLSNTWGEKKTVEFTENYMEENGIKEGVKIRL